MSSKLAEWARDHYLGPVVTFGEWISYQPAQGGRQARLLPRRAVGAAPAKKYKATHGFQPNIPEKLTPFASPPLSGEGVWRVLETVKGEPAIFGTFLRPDAVHTSYVAGIVSMDQRLVSFQLRPGAEDPGPGNWKAASWIPPGTRTGLLATFNGGFKLNSAGGGFYLNGASKGALVNGAASVVYYRNGTIKIGAWGSDVRMTPNVVGVRQNLKLLIDHGKIPASVNNDVLGAWGATLGGGYYVWRSGIGITKGGRIIFVYGPALNVQDLANLLKRAGAVEAMQLDINPEWMSFDYYKASGHPADPTPHALLPDPAGKPVPVLLDLQPRFHGSLRTVTAQTSATKTKVAARPRHARRPSWPVAVLRTARPRQWPKNLLVFAAPLAGIGLGRRDWLVYAFVAAAAFGFASVAVYFINDVADAERDRRHPRKRHRPVAAGDLPKRHAVVLGAACCRWPAWPAAC